jgi:hypothetical protein
LLLESDDEREFVRFISRTLNVRIDHDLSVYQVCPGRRSIFKGSGAKHLIFFACGGESQDTEKKGCDLHSSRTERKPKCFQLKGHATVHFIPYCFLLILRRPLRI